MDGNGSFSEIQSDRLSELPDALIIHILSLMEMKDSVKTGTLSKSWKHLWTQVDTIVYDFEFITATNRLKYEEKLGQVVSFIDSSLMRCTSPKIRKFKFRGVESNLIGDTDNREKVYDIAYEDQSFRDLVNNYFNDKLVDKWLSFVLTKNVERLKLEAIDCPAPDCLYRAFSIVKLAICSMDLSVSLPVSWSLLKVLHLSSSRIGDDSLANIFIGCRVLETVQFSHVWGLSKINIMSRTVKKFTILHTEYDSVQIGNDLKIYAPWLEELLIVGSFFIPQTQLVNVSSLKKATIDFSYSCRPGNDFIYDESDGNEYGLWWNDMVYEIVRCVVQIDELTLGAMIIQALAVSKLLGKPYPLLKCKHLLVTSPIRVYDMYPMACLLQNMPYLETLSIDVSHRRHFNKSPYATAHFKNKNLHLSLPNAKLAHLKKVQIGYILEMHQKEYYDYELECYDFELVEHILKYASVLKKLVLSTSIYNYDDRKCLDCQCASFCACQNVTRMSTKLLATHLVGDNTGLKYDLKKRESFFEFSSNNEAAVISED